MRIADFVNKYQHVPILTTDLLLTGVADPASLRVQLARWVKAGHLLSLRSGVYVLAPYFQKVVPTVYFLAQALKEPSYVSLEKALEFHGLIPEAVFTVTSVTTRRPGSLVTPLGRFDFQHIRAGLFWGYFAVTIGAQTGFMAYPEKALLDLFYLRAPGVTRDYLEGLRLQNMEKIDTGRLLEYAQKFGKPGMLRAAGMVAAYKKEMLAQEKSV
ncbi:MAG: hypothetical protein WCO69_01035 [Candidatus Omnitrophota bacterium]